VCAADETGIDAEEERTLDAGPWASPLQADHRHALVASGESGVIMSSTVRSSSISSKSRQALSTLCLRAEVILRLREWSACSGPGSGQVNVAEDGVRAVGVVQCCTLVGSRRAMLTLTPCAKVVVWGWGELRDSWCAKRVWASWA